MQQDVISLRKDPKASSAGFHSIRLFSFVLSSKPRSEKQTHIHTHTEAVPDEAEDNMLKKRGVWEEVNKNRIKERKKCK